MAASPIFTQPKIKHMQHKLIKTENYLLVVDKLNCPAKEGQTFLTKEGLIHTNIGWNYGDSVIIYHLPLNNSPVLEGVPLLPPLENEVEHIDNLAFKAYKEQSEWTWSQFEQIFSIGYNKAKEKYKYTEEDIRKAIDMARMNYDEEGFTINAFTEYEIIKSLQQPKMPVGFEFEINNPMFALTIEPKTTTNSQSQTVWVGKYIFN